MYRSRGVSPVLHVFQVQYNYRQRRFLFYRATIPEFKITAIVIVNSQELKKKLIEIAIEMFSLKSFLLLKKYYFNFYLFSTFVLLHARLRLSSRKKKTLL